MTTISNEPDARAVELGAAIHSLMFRARISVAAMGSAIGVSGPTMSKKLRGTTTLTALELMTIADVLGVDAGDLLQRARRDSNPKPSDLYLVQGGRAASAVRSILTADRPFRHLRAVAS